MRQCVVCWLACFTAHLIFLFYDRLNTVNGRGHCSSKPGQEDIQVCLNVLILIHVKHFELNFIDEKCHENRVSSVDLKSVYENQLCTFQMAFYS